MDHSECKIQMLDLYFSKYNFTQNRTANNEEYNSSFTINYATNNDDNTKIKVTIDTLVTNHTKSITLDLQTVGVFKVDRTDLDKSVYEHLVKVNTVAIIFPFIRSQISLLTTQPGMTPVMLPPINLNALIETKED